MIERRDLTPDLTILRLQPGTPYTFEPGQYCTIGLDGIERPYSIVSAPHEPYLELFVELVPQGELTPKLWPLRVGDAVSLRPRAKGVFTLEQGFLCHLMIATVTGIAPFMSMLRSCVYQEDQRSRFFILQGVSYQDEFAYREELEKLSTQYPEIVTYIPTVSRPREERNCGWRGATGRVNTMVEEYLERFSLDAATTAVYACGHPGMIEDVKSRLSPRGFTVKEERYWVE